MFARPNAKTASHLTSLHHAGKTEAAFNSFKLLLRQARAISHDMTFSIGRGLREEESGEGAADISRGQW